MPQASAAVQLQQYGPERSPFELHGLDVEAQGRTDGGDVLAVYTSDYSGLSCIV
jgi:hypothetical protein